MKRKIYFICMALIVITFSCKEDEDNQFIPEIKKAPLIRRLNTGDQPQNEYIYNYSKLVSEEKSKFNYTRYYYNDKNQLVTADFYVNEALLSIDDKILDSALSRQGLMNFTNNNLGGTIRYEYNSSGQLIKTTLSRPVESTSEKSEYIYTGDRIGREILYWDNKISGYINYEYDESGNLIKETLYSISSSGLPELNTTTSYEFDNKQNPFRTFQILLSPGINTNLNNIIKETYTIHSNPGDGADIIQVTTTRYMYNSDGLPISKNAVIEYQYE
jgi:hypothetical protein